MQVQSAGLIALVPDRWRWAKPEILGCFFMSKASRKAFAIQQQSHFILQSGRGKGKRRSAISFFYTIARHQSSVKEEEMI
ncbi:hypothetical protein Q7C36_014497 [Tachysurus vachellii]|uniref:Uncharacterized protein n=1 Tax=Tachysurus vachellii TaxID=175792 RepID=A0AA88MJ47_TACVA|nr:hypothetical protein Q7C36_014497 [Tachysurus vachellii]